MAVWGDGRGWGVTFIHLFTLHVDVCGLRRVGKRGDRGGGAVIRTMVEQEFVPV